MPSTYQLYVLNWVAGFAHLGSAGALTGLVKKRGLTGKWPLHRMGWKGEIISEQHYELGWFLPAICGSASIQPLHHVVSNGYDFDVLTRHHNPSRWMEYAVSSSMLLWAMATLAGVTDLRSLITIVVCNMALQAISSHMEERRGLGAKTSELYRYIIATWALHIAIWFPMFMAFYNITCDTDTTPPNMVKTILYTTFWSFTSIQLWQMMYTLGQIKEFSTAEAGYVILSLISKQLFVWMTYKGILEDSKVYT